MSGDELYARTTLTESIVALSDDDESDEDFWKFDKVGGDLLSVNIGGERVDNTLSLIEEGAEGGERGMENALSVINEGDAGDEDERGVENTLLNIEDEVEEGKPYKTKLILDIGPYKVGHEFIIKPINGLYECPIEGCGEKLKQGRLIRKHFDAVTKHKYTFPVPPKFYSTIQGYEHTSLRIHNTTGVVICFKTLEILLKAKIRYHKCESCTGLRRFQTTSIITDNIDLAFWYDNGDHGEMIGQGFEGLPRAERYVCLQCLRENSEVIHTSSPITVKMKEHGHDTSASIYLCQKYRFENELRYYPILRKEAKSKKQVNGSISDETKAKLSGCEFSGPLRGLEGLQEGEQKRYVKVYNLSSMFPNASREYFKTLIKKNRIYERDTEYFRTVPHYQMEDIKMSSLIVYYHQVGYNQLFDKSWGHIRQLLAREVGKDITARQFKPLATRSTYAQIVHQFSIMMMAIIRGVDFFALTDVQKEYLKEFKRAVAEMEEPITGTRLSDLLSKYKHQGSLNGEEETDDEDDAGAEYDGEVIERDMAENRGEARDLLFASERLTFVVKNSEELMRNDKIFDNWGRGTYTKQIRAFHLFFMSLITESKPANRRKDSALFKSMCLVLADIDDMFVKWPEAKVAKNTVEGALFSIKLGILMCVSFGNDNTTNPMNSYNFAMNLITRLWTREYEDQSLVVEIIEMASLLKNSALGEEKARIATWDPASGLAYVTDTSFSFASLRRLFCSLYQAAANLMEKVSFGCSDDAVRLGVEINENKSKVGGNTFFTTTYNSNLLVWLVDKKIGFAKDIVNGRSTGSDIDSWFKSCDKLMEVLSMLVMLSMNGSAKGSEFVRLTYVNLETLRSLMIENSQIALYIRYAKGTNYSYTNVSNQSTCLPHFLPENVGELLVKYLTIIRPMYIEVAHKQGLDVQALKAFIFADRKGRWSATRFNRSMPVLSSKYYEKPFTTSTLRHCTELMEGQLITGTNDLFNIASRMNGHNQTGNAVYSNITGIAVEAKAYDAARKIADVWHNAICSGVKPSILSILKKKEYIPMVVSTPAQFVAEQRVVVKLDTPDYRSAVVVKMKELGMKFRDSDQRVLIEKATDMNQHMMYVLRAGWGKSLLFMIPSLIKQGSTLLVVPYISNVMDVIRRCKEMGISCSSFQPNEPLGSIAVVTYERCQSVDIDMLMTYSNFRSVVFDEAHCLVSEYLWRSGVWDIKSIIERWSKYVNILFMSATIPSYLQSALEEIIVHRPQVEVYKGKTNRPEIEYIVEVMREKRGEERYISGNTFEQLVAMELVEKWIDDFLKESGEGEARCIVYCTTKVLCEEVKDKFKDISSIFHADIEEEDKVISVKDWKEGRTLVMVATSAFGAGVNYGRVSHVIHVGCKGLIEYVQGSGMGGRDGKPAKAILIPITGGIVPIGGMFETIMNIDSMLMKEYVASTQCRRYFINYQMDGEEKAEGCMDGSSIECDICRKDKVMLCTRPTYEGCNRTTIRGVVREEEEEDIEPILTFIYKIIEFGTFKKVDFSRLRVNRIVKDMIRSKIERVNPQWKRDICVFCGIRSNVIRSHPPVTDSIPCPLAEVGLMALYLEIEVDGTNVEEWIKRNIVVGGNIIQGYRKGYKRMAELHEKGMIVINEREREKPDELLISRAAEAERARARARAEGRAVAAAETPPATPPSNQTNWYSVV